MEKKSSHTRATLFLLNLNSRMKMKKSVCIPCITHITGITSIAHITVYSSAIHLCYLVVP